MPRLPGCEECDRLWSEYGKATFEHVGAEGKLELASLQHNAAVMEELTLAMEDALRHREVAREAIRRHEASHRTILLSTNI